MQKASAAAYAHLCTIGAVTAQVEVCAPVASRMVPISPMPKASASSVATTSLGVRPPFRVSGTPGSCSRFKTTSSTK